MAISKVNVSIQYVLNRAIPLPCELKQLMCGYFVLNHEIVSFIRLHLKNAAKVLAMT